MKQNFLGQRLGSRGAAQGDVFVRKRSADPGLEVDLRGPRRGGQQNPLAPQFRPLSRFLPSTVPGRLLFKGDGFGSPLQVC